MKKEQGTATGLFIFALVTVFESLRLSVWEHGSPTSGTFPFFLGLLLAILSALYFMRHTFAKRKNRVVDDVRSQWAEEPEPVVEASEVDWRKVLLSMAAVAAYPVLFMTGGYVIGTAIFLFFMCKVVERLEILATVLITLSAIIVSYVVFGILLNVPLH
jgi:hypothetical protein